MSDIETNLQNILDSVYGRDVRQAIHDAIHDCYEDGKTGATDLIARERISQIVSSSNSSLSGYAVETKQFGLANEQTIAQGGYAYTGSTSFTEDVTIIDVVAFNMVGQTGVPISYNLSNRVLTATATVPYTATSGIPVMAVYLVQRPIKIDELADIRIGEDGTEYSTAGDAVREQISDLKSQISDIEEQIEGGTGSGLTEDVKTALMNCFNYVAWKDNDPNASQYISALQSALYPPANLTRITAVYTQSGDVYPSTPIESLKSDLVVTAHMSSGSSSIVSDYLLSGSLTVGTSVITVTYGGKITTFSVIVTETPVPYNLNYAFSDIELTDGYINDSGELATLENNKLYNELVPAVGFCLVTSSGSVYVTDSNKSLRLAEYGSTENFIARTYVANTNKIVGSNNPSYVKMGFSNSDTVLAGAERFVGLNVLDTTLCTIPNMNVDADGNEVAMADVSLSDYLPINSDGYIVAYVQNNYDTEVIAFFDENRNIISRHPVVSGGANQSLITAVAVPSNAKYVRFRCATTPHATQYISYVR